MVSFKLLVRSRAVLVWIGLVFATAVSWLVGHQHSGSMAAAGVLVIAVVKVRFVGLDFMELRGAPRALRLAFEAYCCVLAVTLVGLYRWG